MARGWESEDEDKDTVKETDGLLLVELLAYKIKIQTFCSCPAWQLVLAVGGQWAATWLAGCSY